jgi:hypothetical protein
VVAAIKVTYNVDKVTDVREAGPNQYTARTFNHIGNRQYVFAGLVTLRMVPPDLWGQK